MDVRLTGIVVLLLLCAPPVRAERSRSITDEIARVIVAAHASAPHRSWDVLRVALPSSVRWHLAAPEDRDRADVPVRRTGFIQAMGRQAGVAACGDARRPILLTLRVDTGAAPVAEGADPVLAALRRAGRSLTLIDRPLADAAPRYVLSARSAADAVLELAPRCTSEASRASRRCQVSYTLEVSPDAESAPPVYECPAP